MKKTVMMILILSAILAMPIRAAAYRNPYDELNMSVDSDGNEIDKNGNVRYDFYYSNGDALSQLLLWYADDKLLSGTVEEKISNMIPSIDSSDINISYDTYERFGKKLQSVTADAGELGISCRCEYGGGIKGDLTIVTIEKEAFKYLYEYYPPIMESDLESVSTLSSALSYFSEWGELFSSPENYSDDILTQNGYYLLNDCTLKEGDSEFPVRYDKSGEEWYFTVVPPHVASRWWGMFETNVITMYYGVVEQRAVNYEGMWKGCHEYDIKLVYSDPTGSIDSRELERIVITLDLATDELTSAPDTGDGVFVLIALAVASAGAAVMMKKRRAM